MIINDTEKEIGEFLKENKGYFIAFSVSLTMGLRNYNTIS